MKITKTFLLLISIIAAAAGSADAQVTTSPYSMYGYGILSDHATSAQRQMGTIGYAMRSGRQINVMNPASYAGMDSLTFLWDIGADISFVHSQEGSYKENSTGGGLDYLTMQFPLSKHFGGSVGLLPVSSVGYAFGNEIKHGTMENQGSGGLNLLYFGLAANYYGIGIGANISYRFGNIINDVYSTPEGSGRTLFEHVMQVRDWDINIGLQYTLALTKADRVTLGATYTPRKSFLGKTWVTNQNLGDNTSKPDTVAYMRMKGSYYQPHTIGAGINYTHARQSRFMVEADFTYQNWKDAPYSPLYDEKGNTVFQGMEFNDRYKVAVGGEYVPKLRGRYLQRVAYRIGGYYSRDYLNIRGNNVKEYGVSCGFGFPTPEGRTVINLGFDWKHRMTSPTSLISENYFNITLGVNFNELWFYQRKIK